MKIENECLMEKEPFANDVCEAQHDSTACRAASNLRDRIPTKQGGEVSDNSNRTIQFPVEPAASDTAEEGD